MHHNNRPFQQHAYNQRGQQQRQSQPQLPDPSYPPFSTPHSSPAPYPPPLPSFSNSLCNISPEVLRKVREEYGKQLAERQAREAEVTRWTDWQRLERKGEIEVVARRRLEQERQERDHGQQYAFMANFTETHEMRPNEAFRLNTITEQVAPPVRTISTAKATTPRELLPTPPIPRVQLSLHKAVGLPSTLTEHLSRVLQDGRVLEEISKLRTDQAIKERELLERRKLLALQHGKRRKFAKNRPGYEDVASQLEEELFEEMRDLDVRCIRELDALIEVQQKNLQQLGVPTFKVTMDTSELALQARVLALILDNMPKSS